MSRLVGYVCHPQEGMTMLTTITRALAVILMVAGCLAGSGCLNLVPGDPPHSWNQCEDSACSDARCAALYPDRPVFDRDEHRCAPFAFHFKDRISQIGERCGFGGCAEGAFCGWQEKVCLPFSCYDKYEACARGKTLNPVGPCAEVCQ
jgi:hypothetical protein